LLISSRSVNKHGHHRQFLFLIGRYLKKSFPLKLSSQMNRNLVGSIYMYYMEGSVLSFFKAEWKVSDTGSTHGASSLICELSVYLNEILSFCMWLYIALHDNFASNIVSSILAENECTLPAAYEWTGQWTICFLFVQYCKLRFCLIFFRKKVRGEGDKVLSLCQTCKRICSSLRLCPFVQNEGVIVGYRMARVDIKYLKIKTKENWV
jgi:hypothetical protein